MKIIAFSHVHFDHAGGVAELQRLSGATVVASPIAARALRAGQSGPVDPQFGVLWPITPVPAVREVQDGEVVRVGPLALAVHFTAGHTPGGTSWSWTACDGGICRDVVYADSQSPASRFATRSHSLDASGCGVSRMSQRNDSSVASPRAKSASAAGYVALSVKRNCPADIGDWLSA